MQLYFGGCPGPSFYATSWLFAPPFGFSSSISTCVICRFLSCEHLVISVHSLPTFSPRDLVLPVGFCLRLLRIEVSLFPSASPSLRLLIRGSSPLSLFLMLRLQRAKEEALVELEDTEPKGLDTDQVLHYVKDLKAPLSKGTFMSRKLS
jgi:hypothetical protein